MEIINYKPVNKGAFQGSFSFKMKVGEFMWVVHNCQLMMSNGRRWINLPQKEYTDTAGQKKWFSLNQVEGDGAMQRLTDALIKQLDAYIAKNSESQQPIIAKPKASHDEGVPF